jgi:hypothetical protein
MRIRLSHSGDPPAGGSGLGSTGASELATSPFSACNRGSVNAVSVTPCSSAKVRRLPLRCNSQRRHQLGSEEKSCCCCCCTPFAVTVTRLSCPPSAENPSRATRSCQVMVLAAWLSVVSPSSPSSEELSSSSSHKSVLHKGQVADLSASHLPMHLKHGR